MYTLLCLLKYLSGMLYQLQCVNMTSKCFIINKINCEISSFLRFILFFLIMCVCEYLCACAYKPQYPERSEEGAGSPAARLQVVVSCPLLVLGTELKSSSRASVTLNCWAIPQAPHFLPFEVTAHCGFHSQETFFLTEWPLCLFKEQIETYS